MADAETTVYTCKACAAQSTWKAGFVDASTIPDGPQKQCITCEAYRRKYRDFFVTLALTAGFFLGIGWMVMRSAGGAVAFAVATYLFAYTAIVIHELGHAGVGKLLGFEVAALTLGGGRRTRVLRYRDRFLIIGPMPSEGLAVLIPDSVVNFRRRMIAITFAGPLVNFLAAAPALYVIFYASAAISAVALVLLKLWAAVNSFHFVVNLLWFRSVTPQGEIVSDGRRIVELLFTSDELVAERVRASRATIAALEYAYGDKQRAAELLRKELHAAPIAIKVLASAALADTGDLETAIRLCRECLQDQTLELHERAMIENNLAWALAATGDRSDLNEANALSARAFEVLPMMLAVRGTRGKILATLGDSMHAIRLLDDERFCLESETNQCAVLCELAIACAQVEEKARADDCLARAEALCPRDERIEKARGRVAAAATLSRSGAADPKKQENFL